jgi:hypothetical protein
MVVDSEQGKRLQKATLGWINARRVEVGCPPLEDLPKPAGTPLLIQAFPSDLDPQVFTDQKGARLCVTHKHYRISSAIPAIAVEIIEAFDSYGQKDASPENQSLNAAIGSFPPYAQELVAHFTELLNWINAQRADIYNNQHAKPLDGLLSKNTASPPSFFSPHFPGCICSVHREFSGQLTRLVLQLNDCLYSLPLPQAACRVLDRCHSEAVWQALERIS